MDEQASPQITLPNETKIDSREAGKTVQAYLRDHAAVLDLYDGTNAGPHDDILPVDLLALNALNAYIGTAPMTPMEALWKRAPSIHPYVAAITTREIQDLSDSDVKAEIPKIVAALQEIDRTDGYGGGGTRTAKVLHRLRPNVVPIWDALVGEWYHGSTQPWDKYLQDVFRDVRRPENLMFLKSIPIPSRYGLGILRRWDILLWKLRYDQRRGLCR